MSSTVSGSSGGQPSTTQPIATPWLSPKVVTRNMWPKVLKDIALRSPALPKISNVVTRSEASNNLSFVMAGLVPAIHVLACCASSKDMDARDEPGHDGGWVRVPRP